MWAVMSPYGKITENDIWPFPWEENLIKELSEKEAENIRDEIDQKAIPFWEKYDAMNAKNLN